MSRIWWAIRHFFGGCHMSRCRMVRFSMGDYLECQDCFRQWKWDQAKDQT